MTRIDDRVREHYEAQSLDPATARRLAKIVRSSDRSGVRLLDLRVVAAAAILIATIFGVASLSGGPEWRTAARRAADEIAMNHRKALPVEFAAVSFTDLRAPMDRLDFTPVAPARLADDGLRLVGARYCAIGGRIASQVKLTDESGAVLTLYEFASTDAYADLEETTFRLGDVSVTVWRESGLVMGLAR